ncbi:metallophosphoesterase family protein [Hyphomonas sp.]|uniref:metallophosphoesterase family protein n=1 Tax=Hyphomonas sp. TaxID=87 RepID=UPI0025BE26E0|nr:metallophosphoesterase family protein [Hyphomonas sp.]
MPKLTQQIQKSFIARLAQLTRSTTSLRARMRQGFNAPADQVETPVRQEPVAVAPRISHAPDGECIYAIGDIHGRCDLLERLVEQIEQDSETLPAGTKRTLIFLGDYIDRGLQSRDVIDFLTGDRLKEFGTVFLMGNHEEALLRFLSDAGFGKQWVRYGGGETLYSYGFQPPNTRSSLTSHEAMTAAQKAWEKVWTGFRERLPDEHLNFYNSLQSYHVAGDYLFVHAGMRPDVPLEQQSARDLLWIRDEFLDDTKEFEHIVVHGHTPAEGVFRDNRRIGLDTGAFISGRLSAAKLFKTDVSFLETSPV